MVILTKLTVLLQNDIISSWEWKVEQMTTMTGYVAIDLQIKQLLRQLHLVHD